jgi:predicted MFS family arabinose efflux permease
VKIKSPTAIGAWSLAVVGLFNILGTLAIGWAIGRYRMKYLLSALYATRGVAVLLFVLAPKTVTVLMLFSIVIGLTYLATVPPTAAIVGKLFGTRFLATLFGMTLVSHQIGGFLGAWLGGLALAHLGNFQWMWYADAALAAFAALVNLPIREAAVPQAAAA